MPVTLTREQVLALAPDDASARAASGLLSDSLWLTLGADDDALWGECKGSGAKPYQTQIDLADVAARCSCPSRKFPCKHGLALMLLFAQRHPRLIAGARPGWVDEWLGSRKEKSARKQQSDADKPARDPVASASAAAKREAARWKRIEDGAAELRRWIADQFRHGLASFGAAQKLEGSTMAARMVDAQAPGLGAQLQLALEAMGAGSSRHEEAIERLGLLQLLTDGVQRRASLSDARVADLRMALGWPYDREDRNDEGEHVTDTWSVIAHVVSTLDERLSERRVWLLGSNSARFALLLDFAFKGKGFEGSWMVGTRHTATLAFHPGTVPLRAQASAVAPAPSGVVPTPSLQADIDQASHWFAANPWLYSLPLMLDGATPTRDGERWLMHTPQGSLPMALVSAQAWTLLASSGGEPLRVMGEWDGRQLRPLSAFRDAALQPCWLLDARESAA